MVYTALGLAQREKISDFVRSLQMAKTSPASKAKGYPVPDSLIEMHCARQDWEDSILDMIEQAHAARDAEKVMSLLTVFFKEGPGKLKEDYDKTTP